MSQNWGEALDFLARAAESGSERARGQLLILSGDRTLVAHGTQRQERFVASMCALPSISCLAGPAGEARALQRSTHPRGRELRAGRGLRLADRAGRRQIPAFNDVRRPEVERLGLAHVQRFQIRYRRGRPRLADCARTRICDYRRSDVSIRAAARSFTTRWAKKSRRITMHCGLAIKVMAMPARTKAIEFRPSCCI